MPDPGPGGRPADDLTDLLNRLSNGQGGDVGPFEPGKARLEDVYALIHLVVRRVRRPRADHLTAETTDLANRVYERTMLRPPSRNGQSAGDPEHPPPARWGNRDHFIHYVVRLTINLLIDDHRKENGAARGGGTPHVPLDGTNDPPAPEDGAETAELALLLECLERYRHVDPRGATVVTLRYFVGLTAAETARAIGTCRRTVSREWESARSWLMDEMMQAAAGPEGPP